MKVTVSARARREADRRDRWWRENRPEAVDLFTRELLDVLHRLRTDSDLGSLYEAVRFKAPVRRVLMPRTETHLYHAQIGDEIVILAVWAARRGRGPKI